MGDEVIKRFKIETIIASIDGIKEGTESFPDLSGVVESMREEEDGGWGCLLLQFRAKCFDNAIYRPGTLCGPYM